MRVDVDAAHVNLLFLRDDIGDVVDDADVVVTYDAQGDGILVVALSAPTGFHNAVAEAPF